MATLKEAEPLIAGVNQGGYPLNVSGTQNGGTSGTIYEETKQEMDLGSPALFPIGLLMVPFSFLGDGARDALDPRVKE